jgi:uncharacterized protein YecT (DUF1311 family)
MDRIKWLALLAFATLAAPAYAQETGAAAACDALLSPYAQSACLEKLADAADAKMNEVYRHAFLTIGKSDHNNIAEWKTALKSAQQTWIAFRDADCGPLAGYEWNHGTGMGAATERCLLEKTTQRTQELVQRYIVEDH